MFGGWVCVWGVCFAELLLCVFGQLGVCFVVEVVVVVVLLRVVGLSLGGCSVARFWCCGMLREFVGIAFCCLVDLLRQWWVLDLSMCALLVQFCGFLCGCDFLVGDVGFCLIVGVESGSEVCILLPCGVCW